VFPSGRLIPAMRSYFLLYCGLCIAALQVCRGDALRPPGHATAVLACLESGHAPPGGSPCDEVDFALDGKDSLSYTNTFTEATLGSTYFVNGNAISTFGSVGAFAETSLADPSISLQAFTDVEAAFTDVLTISFGGLTGPGFLSIEGTVTGSESQTGSGAAGEFLFAHTKDVQFPPGNQRVPNRTGLVVFPELFPFTFGVPFDLTFGIDANAGAGPGNGTSTLDFFSTATLSGLKVFDADMNPISAPTFESGSGTQYTVDGVVPEPTSFVLLVLGVLFLSATRLRVAQQRPRGGQVASAVHSLQDHL
jgi:hypothetical protein